MITDNIQRLCAEHEISIFALENQTGIGNGCMMLYKKAGDPSHILGLGPIQME